MYQDRSGDAETLQNREYDNGYEDEADIRFIL